MMKRRGLLLVLSSPSGAGKTTLVKALLSSDDNIHSSVSVTTRPIRPGEIDGHDYHFVTPKQFKDMQEQDCFLESAKVFGNDYGTPKEPVFNALKVGQDVIFDIDWQGTQKLAQFTRDDLVSIFILPPSLNSLKERLIKRAQDSKTVVDHRMNEASLEISHWAEYDYVIINHTIDESLHQLQSILTAERLKRHRLIGLSNFVDRLRTSL